MLKRARVSPKNLRIASIKQRSQILFSDNLIGRTYKYIQGFPKSGFHKLKLVRHIYLSSNQPNTRIAPQKTQKQH